MASAQADLVFKDRALILTALIEGLLSRVPDARTDIDSNFRLLFEVVANEFEGQYLAAQILFEDIWPQTADSVSLLRFGDEFGFPVKDGTRAEGALRISGEGGTFIPVGAQFAATFSPGEIFLFLTTQSGTIPNPGFPDAPDAEIGIDGNISGTVEYAATYITLEGETKPGPTSQPITPAGEQVSVTVPFGGTGTIGRNVYRMEDGGPLKFAFNIPDNSTAVHLDDLASEFLGGQPPAESTAERLTLAAESEQVGLRYNVAPQTVMELANVPPGIVGATNISAFTGGTDPQSIEDYRAHLLQFIRDPQSGSPGDLKRWAEEVIGVSEATVFVNMDIETPKNGHNTIRIAGPAGTIPDAGVVAAVVAKLVEEDLANITNHVTTFDPVTVDVDVTVTVDDDYSLVEVTPSVQEAVANYINLIPVNETVYLSGIVDAVFGLVGIVDVVVTDPVANITTDETEKTVAGDVTVSE